MLDGVAPVNNLGTEVVTQVGHESARSVPKCAGRNGRYETVLPYWGWIM
jgi:hypothetical protein